jgi:manganese/iron transport system permease protein
LGVYISFFLDSSPAATIVLLMSAVFCILFSYQNYLNYKTVQRVTSENKALARNSNHPLQNV